MNLKAPYRPAQARDQLNEPDVTLTLAGSADAPILNRPEKSMTDAVQTRQRMLALALPLTAALYIAAEGTDPKGTDRIVTTTAIAFKVLPIAARHSTQLYAAGALSVLALGGVAVSYAAIAMLVRGRGSTA